MCIAALAWDAHPDWLLVALGNRDEFHARPSAPLTRWDDGSGILAGRDELAGGTWLGVSERGRFALITNYRVSGYPQPDRPSRGGLVTAALAGEDPAALGQYNPFNLLLAGPEAAMVLTNHPQETRLPLAPGVHGLSNGDFGHVWPKTHQLCADVTDWLARDGHDTAPLFTALRKETPGPAAALPEHGPDPDYAPVFIRNPVYGTRCSTVVTIARDGQGTIAERRFDEQGKATGETALPFHWPGL
ncbi:MAG: NRDE family protein [Novosphingobium sp.]|nr:NRDE family protein [Novosphingobium sp.]